MKIKLTKQDWKKFDKIGINRDLVKIRECGLWFKNMGCLLICNDLQKKKLLQLNNEIEFRK